MAIITAVSAVAQTCLLLVLPAVHLVTTFRTGCIQRRLALGIRASLSGGNGTVSPFGALSVTLASTIGTGNIVGVGTAVALGGPGAVFWIVLMGFFGMATKYAEVYIALTARARGRDGIWRGGAMYVLKKRLRLPLLASAFAAFTVLASLGIGGGVQSAAVASVVPLPGAATGVLLCALTLAALAGGTARLSRVCALLVPLMAGLYIGGCAVLLFTQREYIPEALRLIVASALAPRAAGGGISASAFLLAMRTGAARGLFSNEAGLGSAPIAASCADMGDKPLQALVASTGTFWDTVVICSITGLTVVSGMLMYPELASVPGGVLMASLFAKIPWGGAVLPVSICVFAYSTVLGWSVYGERAAEYLGGRLGEKIYRAIFVASLYLGAALRSESVWALSDVFNTLMALPNIFAVLRLSGETGKAARHRFGNK